nr:CI [Hippeastrum mosaic virus]
SLDTIDDILESKQQVVDVELSTNAAFVETPFDSTFEKWWDNQMQVGNTIPHYRTGGFFMEFKRNWAPKFCSDVINSDEKEFLISGAVGSGKSTGLPFNLSQKGRILVLEPTRPLAENVCAQLRKHPFFCSPSLFMRNVHTVGHSPIDVMTSGFALHSLANKREKIFDYQFIMFDECHVLDSSAMAFYCLLQEVKFPGKILKVSATPPGHECEFETQHPVEVIREASLTFTQFAQNLGTGAYSDVLKKGVNILVYVASYNDVDSLSKLLIEKQFMVTKIDGRTLKSGTNEIATRGTKEKPHFLVATNIIENGVTLDIDVVVDFGTKVVAQLDSDSRRITYSKTNISYGERIQRLGRVGRNKPGTALRLGHTEMGLSEIPVNIATEAAFLSFAYNLPVMTHNVSTSLLGKCTKRQAITALQFELPIYYTSSLIASNGSMHPEIHEVLKPYKLRYSRVEMHELSFQMGHTAQWLTVRDYSKLGVDVQCEPEMKLAFYARDVPERLHEKIWRIVCDLKTNSTRCSIRSHNASKIAYTLRTDPTAVQTSIAIIDQLLEEEQLKQSYMQSLSLMSSSASFISWSSMINAVRSRYAVDHTGENIEKLQRVKARLTEFNNITRTGNYHEAVTEFMEAEAVHYQ